VAFERVKPTYLLSLIPWSRVLLEKLTSSQLFKKFPAFYGTRKFITSLTSARHLSLVRARSIKSRLPSQLLKININIILPSTPGSSKLSFPQVSPPKPCIHISSPHMCYMYLLSHSSRFDHPSDIW